MNQSCNITLAEKWRLPAPLPRAGMAGVGGVCLFTLLGTIAEWLFSWFGFFGQAAEYLLVLGDSLSLLSLAELGGAALLLLAPLLVQQCLLLLNLLTDPLSGIAVEHPRSWPDAPALGGLPQRAHGCRAPPSPQP
ncbi:hypothetical protein [Zobellella sp. DQSA1]|uniref:hypothetical protein n=1 Tax=Zobellella sp. DQSA1 TaxID=3342386 RepID=UPI0035BF7158